MATILERIKKKVTSPVSPSSPMGLNPIAAPINTLVSGATKAVNKVLSPTSPVTKEDFNNPAVAQRVSSPTVKPPTAPVASTRSTTTKNTTNTPVINPPVSEPPAPAGNGRSFSAATAGEFKSLYGREPEGQELRDFVAGTYKPVERPVTPAPVSNTGVSTTTPSTNPDIALAAKLLKAQYGDALTDSEYQMLAERQLSASQTKFDTQKTAYDALLAKQGELTKAEESRLAQAEADMARERQVAVEEYRRNLEAQADPERLRTERSYTENLATSERLLGARGNLTSAVGFQNARDLEEQKVATLNAIDARVAAQAALFEAEQEGADQATLDNMQDRVNALRDAENSAILTAEANLQTLKQEAALAGDEALLGLVQSSLDSLSVDKVKSKADATLTKNIGDGFIYDEYGQRVTDTDGNLITYETVDDLDGLMEISAGASLYDPTTRTFVATAPKDGQTSTQNVQGLLDSAKNADAAYNEISELLNSPELIKVFGPTSSKLPDVIAGNKPTVETKLDRIKALLTTTELSRMKGLGAMSDREFANLSALSTALRIDLKEDVAVQEMNKILKDLEPTKVFNDLINAGDSIEEAVKIIKETYPDNSRFRNTTTSFNPPAGTGSTTLRDGMRASTPFGESILTGVEGGSKKWAYGLDLVINGGKGAPVPSPVSGTVLSAGKDGGFGNSVRVQLQDGRIVRLSHLDAIGVQPGQTIKKGQITGTQGNSGSVYSTSGGDGTHLDVTIYDQNGKPYSSQQVAQLLGVQALA